jgi:hypothetical protein
MGAGGWGEAAVELNRTDEVSLGMVRLLHAYPNGKEEYHRHWGVRRWI